jgi:hypothetical protein
MQVKMQKCCCLLLFDPASLVNMASNTAWFADSVGSQLLKSHYKRAPLWSRLMSASTIDLERTEALRREQIVTIQQRLSTVRSRMNQIYEDKLDCKITEEFWKRKQAEYGEQERVLETQLSRVTVPMSSENLLTVERTFELANKAHFLYLTRNSVERGQLLKSILLNCATDGVTLTPTYRKPFDLIFQRAKNQEWSGRADLNCRPLAPQASALPG